MTDDDYKPIPCGVYSAYELAIMHRQRLRAAWRDADGQLHQELLTPLDLKTRTGAEYLVAKRASGESVELRLDRILKTVPA